MSGGKKFPGDKKHSGDKTSTDDKMSGARRMSGDRRMSDDSRKSGDKKKSRLRRLSSSFIKLLVRRDSGYDSEDPGQQQTAADTPPRSLSLSSTSERLECQDEVDEEAAVDSGDGGEVTDDESLETRQLSNSERHLINIKFALLLEQHRTRDAVVLADVKEIEEMERKEEAEEWQRKLEECKAMEPDLFPRRRRRKASSSSSSAGCAGSDYFDSMLEDRRQERQDSNWRRNWAQRTSSGMYDGYRNNLDYRY